MGIFNRFEQQARQYAQTTLQEYLSLTKERSKTPYYGQILESLGDNKYLVRMENGEVTQIRGSGSRILSPGSGVFVVHGQVVS